MSADFSRQKFWEGEAPVEPPTPNEFGALKIRHQSLAEVSGMGGFGMHPCRD